MKQRLFLLACLFLSLTCCLSSFGQMVVTGSDTDIYLPGGYLEIGINPTGAFGANYAPSTYYPQTGYPGTTVAEVYDWGHDGWTVGSPAEYGDYTYPGSPFEGWELQIAGVNSQAFTNSGTASTINLSGGGDLAGGNVSYVNTGSQLIGNWYGTASGGNLTVSMQTVVDTLGSHATMTVVLKNLSSSPITDIYYMRSCDPDNDEALGGPSYFSTDNFIVHQNETPDHPVEVDAVGTLYNDHWSLCTKDCRAKAFIYDPWPISSSTDLSTVYNETINTLFDTAFALNSEVDGDIAIGLLYKIGDIAAHDSAVISYAYIFNDSFSTIDDAFPDPVLIVDGGAVTNVPLPAATTDSFSACTDLTLTSVPVSIKYATTGNWTWSTWTWTPAIGLTSTTGVTNNVNLAALGGDVTYTITGTDSTANCNKKVFILTIHPCCPTPAIVGAFADSIHLGCNGDSVYLTNLSTPTYYTPYWYFGDGSPVDSIENNPVHVYADGTTKTGSYDITLVYAISTRKFCSDTVIKTVTFDHPISAAFTPDYNAVCLGVPIYFANTSVGNGATYLWNFGDGVSDTAATPTHTYASFGTYNVTLVVTDTTPCAAIAIDSINIVSVDVTTGVHDTSVCLVDSMNLHAFTTVNGMVDSVTYLWTPATDLGEPTDSVTGFFGIGDHTYLVTVTTFPLGCTASDTEAIHSYAPVTFTGLTASQTITAGSSVDLNADGAVTYYWTPDDGTLSNPDINDPVATPVDSITTYTVYGMNTYGCLDSASITITLAYSTPEFVPSAFSPNHDGLNDFFKVGNLKNDKLVDFRVYNRWGQEMFKTSNPEIGWDGTFNGTPQDIGVYYYVIIVSQSDGNQRTITGNVTLIR